MSMSLSSRSYRVTLAVDWRDIESEWIDSGWVGDSQRRRGRVKCILCQSRLSGDDRWELLMLVLVLVVSAKEWTGDETGQEVERIMLWDMV